MSTPRLPHISVSGAEVAQQQLDMDRCAARPGQPCSVPLHIGVFFDVVGHDAKTEPLEAWTNIGLLWRSFPSNAPKIATIYIPGMGTRFDVDSGSYFKAVAASAAKELSDAAINMHKNPWPGHDPRQSAYVPLPKKRPFRLIASALLTLIKSTATAIPHLRDSKALTNYNLGLETRINAAIVMLEKNIHKHAGAITEVRIYVYGAERGGSLARLFVNAALASWDEADGPASIQDDEITGGKRLPVHFSFLGLFDCISSMASHDSVSNPVKEEVQGMSPIPEEERDIDADLSLNKAVHFTYHLVAGHELRAYQRIDSLRTAHGSVRERVLPGSSEDVTGDIAPGDAKSPDLARVALWRMYQTSLSHGVPLLTMAELKQSAKAVAERYYLSKTVTINGRTFYADDLLDAYERQAIKGWTLQSVLPQHLRAWLPWLRRDLPNRKDYMRDHTPVRAGGMHKPLKPGEAPPTMQEILEQRTAPLVADLRDIKHGYARVEDQWWDAWLHGPEPTPEQAALFAHFMHDAFELNVQRKLWLFSEGSGLHYFQPREIDDHNAVVQLSSDDKKELSRQANDRKEKVLDDEEEARRIRAKEIADAPNAAGREAARATEIQRQKDDMTELNAIFKQKEAELLSQGKSTVELKQVYQMTIKQRVESYNRILSRLPGGK